MSFSYTVRESISGFKRTKLSTFVSILTISISLLLLGVFAVITINTSRFIDTLRNKVEMEAFLQEPMGRDQVADVIRTVASIPGVEGVVFVSKEEAAEIFKEQFGEDLKSVLEFNPLPPSLKIFLEQDYRNAARANEVYETLRTTKGIESVIYRKALLEFIDQKTARRKWPAMNFDRAKSILWCPTDGYLQPSDLTMSYVAHARQMGVRFQTARRRSSVIFV